MPEKTSRNPEGVVTPVAIPDSTQPFQGCIVLLIDLIPGLPKRNPGLELANAFSVSAETGSAKTPIYESLTPTRRSRSFQRGSRFGPGSFVSQCHQRIHLRRAPGGNVAGE